MAHLGDLTTASALPLALAWGSFPHIDLTWPPVQASQVEVDGDWVRPEILHIEDAFPCALVDIPHDVRRMPFPLDGGSLQLNFTAPGNQLPSNTSDIGEWFVVSYIGQFNGNMTISQDSWLSLSRDVWRPDEFVLGTQCLDRIYLPYLVQKSLYSIMDFVGGRSFEGVNATIGVSMWKFDALGSNVAETNEVSRQLLLLFGTSR